MITRDWQFEVDGLLLGKGTPYGTRDFSSSDVEIVNHDTKVPRGHGTWFGGDWLGGVTWTLDLQVRQRGQPEAVLDLVSALRSTWRKAAVSLGPGEVMALLLQRPGREAQRIYGRPRKCTPATAVNVILGTQDVVAEFVAADDLVYSDEEHQLGVSATAAVFGGFTFPAEFPWSAADIPAPTLSRMDIGGSEATPICVDFHGPRLNPSITVDGAWTVGLDMDLGVGESVTVDPRSWARTALTQTGGNAVLSAASPTLDQLVLDPGVWSVSLGGEDLTGSSSAVVRWREANPSW